MKTIHKVRVLIFPVKLFIIWVQLYAKLEVSSVIRLNDDQFKLLIHQTSL